MVGDDERGDSGAGDIERLVNGAMGQSVTPSRFHEASNVGFFRRLLGTKPVEGKFVRHVVSAMSRRTPEEQAILDEMAEFRDEEWVAEHEELILTQARLVGEL